MESPEEKTEALAVLMRCMTGREFSFTERLAGIVTVARITVDSYTGKRRPVRAQEQEVAKPCTTD